jgi:hypothetical protein
MKEGQAIVGGCGMGAQCAAARYGMEDAGATGWDGREDRTKRFVVLDERRITFDALVADDDTTHPLNDGKGRTSVVIADVATHACLSTSSLTSEFLASLLTSLEMRISIHVIIANGSEVGSCHREIPNFCRVADGDRRNFPHGHREIPNFCRGQISEESSDT